MQTDLDLCVFLLSWLSHAHSGLQLSDVAKGLEYLHSRNLIHGDLKGVCDCPESYFTAILTLYQRNILVDIVGGTPRARITGFGIALVTKNLDSIRPATPQNIYTPRWSAPEVFREQNPTKETDIYSFAMTVIEVQYGLFCVRLPLTVVT